MSNSQRSPGSKSPRRAPPLQPDRPLNSGRHAKDDAPSEQEVRRQREAQSRDALDNVRAGYRRGPKTKR